MTATTAFYNVFCSFFVAFTSRSALFLLSLPATVDEAPKLRLRVGGAFSTYRQKAPNLKKHQNYTVCYSLRARSFNTVDFSPSIIDFFHIAAKKKVGYLEVNKLPLLFQNLPPSTEHTHSTANLSHLSTQQASSSAYCVSPKDTLPKILFYLVTF